MATARSAKASPVALRSRSVIRSGGAWKIWNRHWQRVCRQSLKRVRCSIVAADAMELDGAGYRKSHSSIKLYRMMVLGADMEPGDQAFAPMISSEMPDQACGVTSAAMRWMSTDSANLGVAVECYTFTAHCN